MEFGMHLASVAGRFSSLDRWFLWLRTTVLGDRSRALMLQLVDFDG